MSDRLYSRGSLFKAKHSEIKRNIDKQASTSSKKDDDSNTKKGLESQNNGKNKFFLKQKTTTPKVNKPQYQTKNQKIKGNTIFNLNQ